MHPSCHADYYTLFDIYCPDDKPDFILPFLQAPVIARLQHISQACGTHYTGLYNYKFVQNRLEHSIGVALIIRHFTKNKKATLAGLFHDVSHSAFSHVGDFLLGDAEHQESSEQHTTHLLKHDEIIIAELNKLGIRLDDVDDYEQYPIADNPGPQLAADRLEYMLSSPIVSRYHSLEDINHIYSDICILTNEHGVDELGFRDTSIAESFAIMTVQNDERLFSSYESVLGMSLLAEMLRQMLDAGLISQMDLYTKNDADIINIVEASNNTALENLWHNIQQVRGYKIYRYKPTTTRYCISSICKKRYVDPLVETPDGVQRVSAFSSAFCEIRDHHLGRREERIVTDITL